MNTKKTEFVKKFNGFHRALHTVLPQQFSPVTGLGCFFILFVKPFQFAL